MKRIVNKYTWDESLGLGVGVLLQKCQHHDTAQRRALPMQTTALNTNGEKV